MKRPRRPEDIRIPLFGFAAVVLVLLALAVYGYFTGAWEPQ